MPAFPHVWLDRFFIRVASKSVRAGFFDAAQIPEAERLLQAGLLPAEPPWMAWAPQPGPFTLPSPLPGGGAANHLVHGEFHPAPGGWEGRPTALLIHGWNGEWQYQWFFPRLARWLNAAGFNALRFLLPLHGRRKPSEPGAVRNFISDDLASNLGAARQALAEVAGLAALLRREGSGPVCLWGYSLGAWLAGLSATSAHPPAAALLATPVCDMAVAIQELEFCAPIRAALRQRPLDLSTLSLERHTPRIPPSHILMVRGRQDQFASLESLLSLQRAWGGPEIHTSQGGHISLLFRKAPRQAAIQWLRNTLPPAERPQAPPRARL